MSFTDEDKQWIAAQFERTATGFERFGERVEQLEQRINARFERIAGQIEWMAAQFERIDARFEQIDARIDQLERRLDDRIERVETSLLTEFHKWASPVEQKLRSHREALRALDLQIEAIAARVGKLEAAQDATQ